METGKNQMVKPSRKSRMKGNIGCGYMFSIAFIICALLIINGLLVRAFVNVNLPEADSRIKQAIFFSLPVIMIFVEFWFFDLINHKNSESA